MPEPTPKGHPKPSKGTPNMPCSDEHRNQLCQSPNSDFHNDAQHGFSSDSQPRATDRAAQSGSMHCDLLRWAAQQSLPFAQHSVLVTLALHTDENGRAQISKAQIAKRAGVTDRQVHTVLERLAEGKFVTIAPGERKGRGRPANAYTLNYGTQIPEAEFVKPISRNPIPEENFSNSNSQKSASGSRIQETEFKKPPSVDNQPRAYKSTGAHAHHQELITTSLSELNPETQEPSFESDRAFALTPIEEPTKNDKRGSRIRSDWKPNAETLRMARQLGIVNGWQEATLESFIDYWLGVAGSKGVKLDWDATYRNELRKEVHAQRHRKPEEGGRTPRRNGPYRAGGVTRLAYTG